MVDKLLTNAIGRASFFLGRSHVDIEENKLREKEEFEIQN
jgi:hypothetical protein